MVMRLWEISNAIYAVKDKHKSRYKERENTVQYQLIHIADEENIDNDKLQESIKDVKIGIDVHFLMCHDGGTVRSLRHSEHSGYYAKLIDAICCKHSGLRYYQLMIDEPKANGLKYNKQNDCYDYVDCKGGGKCI